MFADSQGYAYTAWESLSAENGGIDAMGNEKCQIVNPNFSKNSDSETIPAWTTSRAPGLDRLVRPRRLLQADALPRLTSYWNRLRKRVVCPPRFNRPLLVTTAIKTAGGLPGKATTPLTRPLNCGLMGERAKPLGLLLVQEDYVPAGVLTQVGDEIKDGLIAGHEDLLDAIPIQIQRRRDRLKKERFGDNIAACYRPLHFAVCKLPPTLEGDFHSSSLPRYTRR